MIIEHATNGLASATQEEMDDDDDQPSRYEILASPSLYRYIARSQLLYFLIANVLTGLTNIFVNTKLMPPWLAMIMLFLHSAVVNSFFLLIVA